MQGVAATAESEASRNPGDVVGMDENSGPEDNQDIYNGAIKYWEVGRMLVLYRM